MKMTNEELVVALQPFLENSISAEATNILTDAIDRIKNIGKYISSLFKRGTTITIQPEAGITISESWVNDSWKTITTREKEKGNPDPWLDEDIWKWFKGNTIPAITSQTTSVIWRFAETLTYKQILEEAEKLSIKKIYTYLEAKRLIEHAILSGEIDVKGKGVVAYFRVEGNGNFYRFSAWRFEDDQLKVGVSKVSPLGDLGAGFGAFFSN